MKTRDSLGRRFRDVTLSTGKRVLADPTDLEWFEMMHRIGPQTTAALFERTKHVRRDKNSALGRMKNLRHEDKSEYGGPTLLYPPQQTYTHRPDQNLTVYYITKRAERLLGREGRYFPNAPTTNNREWKHDFMGSTVTASIYLDVLQRAGYQFFFHDEIVSRIGTRSFEFQYEVTNKDGIRFQRDAKLRPDGFFGIRYPSGEGRVFIREEDCATERNDTDAPNVKSHRHNILQYTHLLGQRELRKKYFGNARVVVLNTFSNPVKMQNVMKLVLELSGNRGSNFLCYRAWPAFGTFFRPPVPDFSLFGEWERAGNTPLDITKI